METSVLPIFRTDAQARLLARLFLDQRPDGLRLSELARAAELPLGTTHRESERLEGSGLIRSVRSGRERRVSANRDSPFFPELEALVRKAFGPVAVLRAALGGVPGVEEAWIFGSWARRNEGGGAGGRSAARHGCGRRRALARGVGGGRDGLCRGRSRPAASGGRPRVTIAELVAAGRLESVPADTATARASLEETRRHLASASLIAGTDPDGAYALLDDAARRAIAAHMLASGLRATVRPRAHEAVGLYALSALAGSPEIESVEYFDRMRRKRNHTEYGVRTFGAGEIERDLRHAGVIVNAVEQDLAGS
jgi:hypothetical protein